MESSKIMIVWPRRLRVPKHESYGYSPTDRRIKTNMEIGSRYRVPYDTDETVVNCSFLLHFKQLYFFESLEKHLLSQGSKWFEMPLMVGGRIETHIVRFKDRPKIGDFSGDYAIVTMVLDVEERMLMSYNEIMMDYLFGPDYGLEFANRLHEVLHVEASGATIIPDDVWGLI